VCSQNAFGDFCKNDLTLFFSSSCQNKNGLYGTVTVGFGYVGLYCDYCKTKGIFVNRPTRAGSTRGLSLGRRGEQPKGHRCLNCCGAEKGVELFISPIRLTILPNSLPLPSGLTEPAGTGPDTAGTGGTGPARYRFRSVQSRSSSKF
jgi:hypothetical protein